jgi:hypothetical protein
MIGDYLRFEKSAVMHVCLGEPITKVPGFLWGFILQVVFTLLLPVYYPATQETMDLVIRAQMLAVNALLILIITSFVSKVLVLTYSKNMEQREMIRSQYLLGQGDINAIAGLLQNDCLIVQGEGETAAAYKERLDRAKLSATNTFWVISIPKYSQYACAFLHPTANTISFARSPLKWEIDLPADQRLVAVGYDFEIETQENYIRYISYFVEGWRKHGAEIKMNAFKDDPRTINQIVENNIRDNN